MSDPAPQSDSRRHCERELRGHDYDRYLATLMLNGDVRRSATALFAFNLEIARTREIVSEALLGEMRLQFWRDTIDELYNGKRAREHPVAQELGWAIKQHDLPRDPIERLLVARQRDLEDVLPSSVEDLESYVDDTSSVLLELLVHAADPDNPSALEAVGHIGIAFGLSGLLRAVPFHARQGRLYLPADLLDEAGVDREQVFAGVFSPALGVVIEAVVERARARFVQANTHWRDIPRRQRQVLLVGSLARLYLNRLKACAYNPYHPRMQVSPLRRLLRIVHARVLGIP